MKILKLSFREGCCNYVFHACSTIRLIKDDLFSNGLLSHGTSAGVLISFALLNNLGGVFNFSDAVSISASFFAYSNIGQIVMAQGRIISRNS